MPEDLEDKLIDFELMLEGCLNAESSGINERYINRLIGYWYALSKDIKEKLQCQTKK